MAIAPVTVGAGADPEVTLHLPANDAADPELSIVIPALDEELTISDFVAWCHEGMARAGVRGESLIIDSGSDRTTDLAGGARVLKTPKRGLGRPYIDALPHLRRMDLHSQSWEYASEMVLKSVHMGLRTEEVPIRFSKDSEGRLCHHKRSGWFSPWQAGWINLRAMFIYGANFSLYKPGLLLAIGLLLALPLSFGAISVGPITFSHHWMLLGVSLVVLGPECVYLGILSQVFFDYSGRATERWFRRFPYTRTVFVSAALLAAGVVLADLMVRNYVTHSFRLQLKSAMNYLGVTGLILTIVGFMTFTFVLMLHSTAVAIRRRW